MTASKEAAGPTRALLLDYLAKCQATITLCLARSDEHEDPEQAIAAARLIRSSIELIQQLDGKPPTIQEIVIRRADAPE